MKNQFILESHNRCKKLKIDKVDKKAQRESFSIKKQDDAMEKLLIECTGKCLKKMKSSFFALFNSFFTLVDRDLIVLDCFMNKNSNVKLEKYMPSKGISLKEEDYGTTAISLSSLKKDVAYVVKNEHYSKMSQALTCAAVPIKIQNRITGYISISTINKESINGLRVLMESLAYNIEHEVIKRSIGQKLSEYIGSSLSATVKCLSDKERQIVRCLMKGYSNNEIGDALFISEATVKTHLKHIYSKLGTKNKLDTAVLALCNDVIEHI